MSSPRKPKEVMSLAGRVTALSLCAKRSKKFEWTDKYEQAFLALKEYLGRLSLLSKPIEGEKLYQYLTISEEVVNTALVKEEEKVQWQVYYMSKRLLDAKTRYPELEKLALALMAILSRTLDRGLNQLPTAPSATKARSL